MTQQSVRSPEGITWPTPDEPALAGATFRRRLRLQRTSPTRVAAALEDDLHSCTTVVYHDAERIVSVAARTDRAPFDICGNAETALWRLAGTPLVTRIADIVVHVDERPQCNQLFELVALSAIHATSGGDDLLQFDIEIVADPAPDADLPEVARHSARLWRNGKVELRCHVLDGMARLHGQPNFAPIAEVAARSDEAHVLARALRSAGLEPMPAEGGRCYSRQPRRLQLSRRVRNRRDFGSGPDELLQSFVG